MQRWLGHHKRSFRLDTYVHLLAEDIPEPAFADEPSPETCDTVVTQTGLNEQDQAEAARGKKR